MFKFTAIFKNFYLNFSERYSFFDWLVEYYQSIKKNIQMLVIASDCLTYCSAISICHSQESNLLIF